MLVKPCRLESFEGWTARLQASPVTLKSSVRFPITVAPTARPQFSSTGYRLKKRI